MGMLTEVDAKNVVEALTAFTARLDEIFGLYLDAVGGFGANFELVVRIQKDSRHLVSSPEQLDELPYLIGRGDPNDKTNVLLHQTTQGRFKERNAAGGLNDRLLSQYFVVLVFHLWEHEYRARIADILKVASPQDLEMDIFAIFAYLETRY